ncbi:GNAT family N-acetyltransferase [Croceibacterium sp. TMG7-5b_MA50]|uniref:GNAT family N-acetyltransferase n=1 Tax=Croceibacterium sp. TMG7-5b_MA50 TaxID=3121290 RepID=UPI003221ADA2
MQQSTSAVPSADLPLRIATMADAPAIAELMALAIPALLGPYLTPAQIAASHRVMGLDTQLIADGTYFVVHDGAALVGCGGWSRRATVYGGNHTGGRDARLLDPATEPARIRAMYTHPDHARRGIGRRVLAAGEAAARAEGFARVRLAATVGGEKLYARFGYLPGQAFEDGGVPLLPMEKVLV